MLQLLRDFVPQTSYRGFAPGPHWGTSVRQTSFASSVFPLCLRPWWDYNKQGVAITEYI